jgi:lipoyl synthase
MDAVGQAPDRSGDEALLHDLGAALEENERLLLFGLLPSLRCRPLTLHVVQPSNTMGVSLTGAHCHLQCRHCAGHYLRSMLPFERLPQAAPGSYSSLLISGGSDRRGAVPLADHLDEILRLPTTVPLNLHVGLPDAVTLEPLRHRPGVTVSFELVGDDDTVREVFGLGQPAQAWQDAYLETARHFAVIPHLTLGLRGGQFSGEEAVLEFLRRHPPPALVLLVFRPTPGTPMASCQPPSLIEVTRFIARAAQHLNCPIHLGCMRPNQPVRHSLDLLAWAAGARTIVQPTPELGHILARHDLPLTRSHECCVL